MTEKRRRKGPVNFHSRWCMFDTWPTAMEVPGQTGAGDNMSQQGLVHLASELAISMPYRTGALVLFQCEDAVALPDYDSGCAVRVLDTLAVEGGIDIFVWRSVRGSLRRRGVRPRHADAAELEEQACLVASCLCQETDDVIPLAVVVILRSKRARVSSGDDGMC